MSPRSVTWRRIGVSAVALATVAAGSPLLLSSSANAAAPTRLAITQDDLRLSAAAGTCTAFTVTATDPFGTAADSATITVNLAESPESNNHDVDFCLIDGGTPFLGAPRYENEPLTGTGELTGGTTQQYDAGPSITTVPADSPPPPAGSDAADVDNPDQADDANNSLTGAQQDEDNNFNTDGVDQASFRSVGGIVRFGVVGLLPGAAATIDAFVDNGAPFTRDNNADGDTTDAGDDNVMAPQRRVGFTAGGLPGSLAVNNAVTRVVLLPEESFAAKSSSSSPATHSFTLQAFNSSGDVVGGVTQARLIATSGPNAPTSGSPNGTFSSFCTSTGNEGEPAACTYVTSQVGTDVVTGFVNQSTGSPTPGLDTTEPRDTSTATTTSPGVAASQGRFLVLTPESASVQAGTARAFTATVTDVNGAPAAGVSVTFQENGPGSLQSGSAGAGASSSRIVTTDGVGRATVTFLTSPSDLGGNTITAVITSPAQTQCQAAASGTTPAGQCADTSPVAISASSASPTPSTSASPRPSATATATASPRPSASATQGTSCQVVPTVRLENSTITATGSGGVTVTGAPNTVIDLLAYSRPSTTYRVVRSAELGNDGTANFRVVPPTNTRLYAQQRGCAAGPSVVLNVRTQISLNVVRNGVRTYTFSGSLLPARPNGLIASLYRVESSGRQILTAQTRANANVGQPGYDSRRPAGSYSIRRVFTGTGRFGFVVRTGQDLQNAPGSSNVRSLLVF